MRKHTLLFSSFWLIAATALAGSAQDDAALAKSHGLQLEYRQGNLAAAKPLVEGLEAAVTQSTENPKLWEALGHAYMSRQGSLFIPPLDMPAIIDVGERARAAYTRSLALNPDNPLVRVSHGMATMVVSLLKNDGPGIMAGVDEMNATVRDNPRMLAVRLTRGFTIVHLPPAMRDTPAVIEDLRFIIDGTTNARAEDVLHVMLGDVHAEMGSNDAAAAEYALVTGASAFAAEQAKLRVADLAKGAVPPASIAMVRAGTGSNCAMCHAPGIDK
jgi:hypothetical protein